MRSIDKGEPYSLVNPINLKLHVLRNVEQTIPMYYLSLKIYYFCWLYAILTYLLIWVWNCIFNIDYLSRCSPGYAVINLYMRCIHRNAGVKHFYYMIILSDLKISIALIIVRRLKIGWQDLCTYPVFLNFIHVSSTFLINFIYVTNIWNHDGIYLHSFISARTMEYFCLAFRADVIAEKFKEHLYK